MLQTAGAGVLEGQDPIRYVIAADSAGISAMAIVLNTIQQEGIIPQILLQRWPNVGREQALRKLVYALSRLQARTHHRQKASSGGMDDLQIPIVQNGIQ